jgi:hypothetical protein
LLTADAQTVVDAEFTNKTLLEAITTANGTNSITLGTNAAAATANLTVTGGTGDDTINASELGEAVRIIGNAGANVLTGSTKADTITGGADADTIAGGAGADSLTGGAGDDDFVYTDTIQDGSTGILATDVLTAGDVITDFVSGSDDLNYAATATGINVVTASAAAINLTDSGVILVNTSLDFTAGTTDLTAVFAALNAAGASNFTGAQGTVAYFAVLDDNGGADDQYNVFAVGLSQALTGGALAPFGGVASLVTTVTATLVAGDFIL